MKSTEYQNSNKALKESNKLIQLLNSYCEHLTSQSKSRHSIQLYKNPNKQLIKFLEINGVFSPKEITKEHLIKFQQFLYNERDFKHSSIVTFIKNIALFFNYLIGLGELEINWARGVEITPEPIVKKQQSHFYTFDEILIRYIRSQEKYVSFAYRNSIEKHLRGFIKYLRSNEIGSVYPVTEAVILRYRQFLWDEHINSCKDSLVPRGQMYRLRMVVRLFRYLNKEGILKENPTLNLGWEKYYKDILEKGKALPKNTKAKRELTEFDKLNNKFLNYQKSLEKDFKTLKLYKKSVEIFFEYLIEKGIQNVAQVTTRHLLDFYTYVSNYVGVRGKPVTTGYKRQIIWGIKLFFRYLTKANYVDKDPSIDLDGIKDKKGLPTAYMTEKEVFQLIEKPNGSHDPLVLRDKAILAFLFSVGLRSNELCKMNIEDIDSKEGMVRINYPKGGASYQRIVAIGKRALEPIEIYLKEGRPRIETADAKALFLSYSGRRIDTEAVSNIVKKYVHECGFRKNITPHSLRVTCATLMLKNGAPIRHVQEQLGHKRITSTQIYTRLIPKDLKGIHKKYHPWEKKALQPA